MKKRKGKKKQQHVFHTHTLIHTDTHTCIMTKQMPIWPETWMKNKGISVKVCEIFFFFLFVFYTCKHTETRFSLKSVSHEHIQHTYMTHKHTHKDSRCLETLHGLIISEQVSGGFCESCYDLSFSPNASGRNTCHTMFRSIWKVHTYCIYLWRHSDFPSDRVTIVMWVWVTLKIFRCRAVSRWKRRAWSLIYRKWSHKIFFLSS